MRNCLFATFLGLAACARVESLTHPRPRPGDCQVRADGGAIVCGGHVVATLRCSRRAYSACNELVLTFGDGEAVLLHQLRHDPKFDVVGRVAVERNGDRIWFTESDLSLWAMLSGRDAGSSSHARVFHVWTGLVRDDEDAAVATVAARVNRGDAVRLASEDQPTPGKP